eukprot:Clim_evm78s11 gene=Clim_evmTU78s11
MATENALLQAETESPQRSVLESTTVSHGDFFDQVREIKGIAEAINEAYAASQQLVRKAREPSVPTDGIEAFLSPPENSEYMDLPVAREQLNDGLHSIGTNTHGTSLESDLERRSTGRAEESLQTHTSRIGIPRAQESQTDPAQLNFSQLSLASQIPGQMQSTHSPDATCNVGNGAVLRAQILRERKINSEVVQALKIELESVQRLAMERKEEIDRRERSMAETKREKSKMMNQIRALEKFLNAAPKMDDFLKLRSELDMTADENVRLKRQNADLSAQVKKLTTVIDQQNDRLSYLSEQDTEGLKGLAKENSDLCLRLVAAEKKISELVEEKKIVDAQLAADNNYHRQHIQRMEEEKVVQQQEMAALESEVRTHRQNSQELQTLNQEAEHLAQEKSHLLNLTDEVNAFLDVVEAIMENRDFTEVGDHTYMGAGDQLDIEELVTRVSSTRLRIVSEAAAYYAESSNCQLQ